MRTMPDRAGGRGRDRLGIARGLTLAGVRRSRLRRLARTGALLALGLALAVLENAFLPALIFVLPVPGAKLGLANLATLTALEINGLGAAATVSILRVLLAGIFAGTLGAVAFWLSLGGAVLSLAGMTMARRLPGISLVGVSVVGAVCHNLGQLAALGLFIPGTGLLAFLPWLVLLAIPAGLVTGVLAVGIVRRLAVEEGRGGSNRYEPGDRRGEA